MLAESLRASTSGAQSTARNLTEIGNELSRLRDEFERLGALSGQQTSALNGLLGQQAEMTKEMAQVVRDIGSIGLSTAQRQREVNQDFQHLVQRLDSLANTLNRLVQQAPSTENLQQAFTTALRAELARTPSSEPEPGDRSANRWSRTRT
jgi:Mg2+ and Co2+ transporter CorA